MKKIDRQLSFLKIFSVDSNARLIARLLILTKAMRALSSWLLVIYITERSFLSLLNLEEKSAITVNLRRGGYLCVNKLSCLSVGCKYTLSWQNPPFYIGVNHWRIKTLNTCFLDNAFMELHVGTCIHSSYWPIAAKNPYQHINVQVLHNQGDLLPFKMLE